MEIVLDIVKYILAVAVVLIFTSMAFNVIFDAYFSARLRFMRKLADLYRKPQP